MPNNDFNEIEIDNDQVYDIPTSDEELAGLSNANNGGPSGYNQLNNDSTDFNTDNVLSWATS